MEKLPAEYRHWHHFGTILDIHYGKQLDYENNEAVDVIALLLTDAAQRYTIKIMLKNVSGLLSFDMTNGFFSGLCIQDLYRYGYEISSFEQDITFALYCEHIEVELIK